VPRREKSILASDAERGSGSEEFEPRFLAIGQITRAHGVQGEVSVVVLTDFPERFDNLETIYVGAEGNASPYTVQSTRWHKDRVLVHFADVADRTAAEQLRGLYLQIPIEQARQLEPDAYYQHQLIGLAVVSNQGEALGTLIEILETGANDVYVVKNDKRELLLPATNEVIVSIDLEKRQMIIRLLEGL
jgi:16S rRNA processing protein RimM